MDGLMNDGGEYHQAIQPRLARSLSNKPDRDSIEEGVCQPQADVIFTETLRTLERISDHADNLGVSVARSRA